MKKLTDLEVKNILLDILVFFDEFCNKNNLKYSIWRGTAIGAARNNKFIPWDDDIDVYMPREDYDKFLILFKNNDLYTLHDDRDPNYYLPWSKLSSAKTFSTSDFVKNCYGVFIDIFPLDKINNAPFPFKKIYKIAMGMRTCNYNPKYFKKPLYKKGTKFIFLRRFKHFIIKNTISLRAKLFPYKFWKKRYEKLLNKHRGNSAYHIFCFAIPKDKTFDINVFNNLTNILFENHFFKIFNDYDYYLKREYGDNYIKLPPESERRNHNYYVNFIRE